MPTAIRVELGFVTILYVWRKFHVLNAVQAFIVGSLSAAILAGALATLTVLHTRTGLFRDLWWPHPFDPLVIFGAASLALLIVLLTYYHLGFWGVLFVMPASIGAFYGLTLCAMYLFLAGSWVGVIGYTTVSGALSVLLYFIHTVAGVSRKIEQAQRRMGLRP